MKITWPMALAALGGSAALAYMLSRPQVQELHLGGWTPPPFPIVDDPMTPEEMTSLTFPEDDGDYTGATALYMQNFYFTVRSCKFPILNKTTDCPLVYPKTLIQPSTSPAYTLAKSIYTQGYNTTQRAQVAAAYLNRALTYASDNTICPYSECWLTPKWTWYLRKGDCDDYAIFLASIIRNWTYTANIAVGYVKGLVGSTGLSWGSGGSHAFVVFRDPGWKIADALVPLVIPIEKAAAYGYSAIEQIKR